MLFDKYFTPLEAKKTLPLVKQIVRDIINSANDLRLLNINDKKNLSDDPLVTDLLYKINKYVDELKEIGCYYKDWNFELGLVDFPAIINDEEVMLCWKSDEEDILFYHNHSGGFAGRKPIPEKYFVEEVVA
ncbi:MAG: DUF2203 domain-containing protein [Bacteroidetes bacterium]|nr:DUF2203 domain-containing protein [Bacteroidota bacterium]